MARRDHPQGPSFPNVHPRGQRPLPAPQGPLLVANTIDYFFTLPSPQGAARPRSRPKASPPASFEGAALGDVVACAPGSRWREG